jgi:two-component system cell cycle sensor histidine kinase/response regulator CckA
MLEEKDKKLRVLILEDVPADAELVKHELVKAGFVFSSRCVETKGDFLKELREFAPDIILSDYKLPQFDGMAALSLTKEFPLDIPFIIVTGSMNEETAVECMKAGAADYVIKNHLARIGPAVKAALENKRVREEKEGAEEALLSANAYNRGLIEASLDPFIVIGPDGKITDVNAATEAITGYSQKELIGDFFSELFTKPDKAREGYHQMFREGSVRDLELKIQHRDGHIRPVLLNASVFRNEAAKIIGVFAAARDITERKEAEEKMVALQEQLRQSQKMEAIGRLAGGIAHDFNNLLTVIKGYSQLSLVEFKEDDPLRENIEEVKRAADRAANLTRQLLAFGRRQIMEMRVLDLNTLLQNLDKMLRRIIDEDIELVTFLADDLGRVKADPGQIEQVIMNLAVNAKDAMPNGGKLIIETANLELDQEYARAHIAVKPGRYVMFSVSDTGVGMTPEVKERVFEPFFTTKEKGIGTGLGLSTVYGIVKQSGGNIWVYSEPGQGTTFKIYLPRVDEPLEELKERVIKEELPRGSETILVVEDAEEVRKLAARILKRQGYTVLEGSQGDEAYNVCKQHKGPIHLLVTDVVMPIMNGHALAKRLETLHPNIKVLYMSGYTENAIVHHGVLVNGMNYIQKPFTVDELARKVRQVLDS